MARPGKLLPNCWLLRGRHAPVQNAKKAPEAPLPRIPPRKRLGAVHSRRPKKGFFFLLSWALQALQGLQGRSRCQLRLDTAMAGNGV